MTLAIPALEVASCEPKYGLRRLGVRSDGLDVLFGDVADGFVADTVMRLARTRVERSKKENLQHMIECLIPPTR